MTFLRIATHRFKQCFFDSLWHVGGIEWNSNRRVGSLGGKAVGGDEEDVSFAGRGWAFAVPEPVLSHMQIGDIRNSLGCATLAALGAFVSEERAVTLSDVLNLDHLYQPLTRSLVRLT